MKKENFSEFYNQLDFVKCSLWVLTKNENFFGVSFVENRVKL